ncbi:type VI secretion system protein VasG [Andreprevotia lacus DSM 23236]|jgi:type VI secretion system protein VasG|uniref:Type VI secretion system protein VasG n=1 Tax=Andreprevotia lacus DSM 23236 TaxID=1121001 RepID=A0A1W1XND4_9NEIS|nr:type VI secretion system ATPase TssH [Andreprevotia lacus]SMC25021.1 type VI secretion system protein VasG [Andreprevotia lacus DSM 23236]
MADISRTALFEKLDRTLFEALESATLFARYRGNPRVEIAHWLNQLLQLSGSDLHQIAKAFDVDLGKLSADFTALMGKLPQNASGVDFSGELEHAVEKAWMYASLKYGAARIRGAHLLVAILSDATMRSDLFRISSELRRLDVDTLTERWGSILNGSPEGNEVIEAAPVAGGEGEQGGMPGSRGDALKRYTTDLTEQARSGKMDPVSGREDEIRQMIDILIRRRQNNPLLTGEAGVGKTAVVEGLAQRIVEGSVPEPLRNVRLLALDIGMMQAGAGVKGEFESRLKQIINEVHASEQPIILFIDEAHTLIGAGGASGTGDAANLLKPALARGELRTVAATTWSEYKRYIEKDPALTRRFQVVQVHEPDEDKAIGMLRSVAAHLQRHHRVFLLDEAVEAAVKLSHRYIPARQLPDKAVSLLDTACSRVAVSQSQQPAELERLHAGIARAHETLAMLEEEQKHGIDHSERVNSLRAGIDADEAAAQVMTERWQAEQVLVQELADLGNAIRENPDDAEPREAYVAVKQKLEALQQENKLVHPCVDGAAVAAVVADWTGIPVGRMVRDETSAILQLPQDLARRVVGQDHALQEISRQVQIARAGLEDPVKPTGVFMLVGPSGVGKTETALALAELLYGGEENLICINMSEYQESHTVSTLKGAPPGYVGYGEGGVLTEAVRRRPYSVVLLDEVEKAHPDVHELFFQVFDKGWMEDGEGRYIDFRNTLILLTSNVGSEELIRLCADPELAPPPAVLAQELREPLRKVFPAAFLGRLNVVPYYPLSDDVLQQLVAHKLRRIAERLQTRHQLKLEWDDAVLAELRARCNQVESGGRIIDALLNRLVLTELSLKLLAGNDTHQPGDTIRIVCNDGHIVLQDA